MILCAGMAWAVAGCDLANDKVFFRQGIGTELNAGDIEASTNSQNEYVKYVCRQAGRVASDDGDGSITCEDANKPSTWQLFVQAGMNDIDRRCDSYLLWLDYIRRGKDPTLNILSDAATYSAIIMDRGGVSAAPIAITAAALGFARNTFTNVTSRLILEVNHSAVQSVVLSAQKQFREELLGSADIKSSVVIASKPAAIYALRSYLRLCMPVTIEAEINNTVVTFARGGPQALADQDPLVSGRNVGVAAMADQKIGKPVRPVTPTDPNYKKILVSYNATAYSTAKVERVLSKLCVPKGAPVDSKINTAIKVFQQTERKTVSGLLTDEEFDYLSNAPTCTENTVRNYYEKNMMPNGLAAKDLVGDMNRVLKPDRQLANPVTVAQVRSRIGEVREALKSQLVIQKADLPDQFSQDLLNALIANREVPGPAAQPAQSGQAGPNVQPAQNGQGGQAGQTGQAVPDGTPRR